MKKISKLAIVFAAIILTGCMNDQTKAMAQTCQALLDSSDQLNP